MTHSWGKNYIPFFKKTKPKKPNNYTIYVHLKKEKEQRHALHHALFLLAITQTSVLIHTQKSTFFFALAA